MKTKILTVATLGAFLTLMSCQKEKLVPLNNDKSVKSEQAQAHRTSLLSHADLIELMPSGPNSTYLEYKRSTEDGSINEYSRTYKIATDEYINVSVGDFVDAPYELKEVMMGRGIIMDSEEKYTSGITVSLLTDANDEATTECAMMLSESTDQGAISFALASEGWDSPGLALIKLSPGDFTFAESSYIEAYSNSDSPDVAGWQIYDSSTKTAMLILVAPDSTSERFAYILEHTAASDLATIYEMAGTIPFSKMAEL